MKKAWVKYLCDPVDKTELTVCSVSKIVKGDIVSGRLKSKSGNFYKIENGVPILLTKKTQKVSSVESFDYEWNEFDFDYGRKGWLEDIVIPLIGNKNYFKNKIIVDAGAGSGRQSYWMAQSGAKFIFCLELSNAARTIIKKVTKKYKNKIFIIQADISYLPINLKKINIDLVYCVNVIQHTKSPGRTLRELSKLMRRKSEMMFNIYLTKGRNITLKVVNLTRGFTKLIPKEVLKYLSLFIALAMYPFYRLGHNFKEMWTDIYDLLGSHRYQKFYTKKELSKIVNESRLKIIKRSKYGFLLKRKF
jgi:2-polyprenyl-3-methyl-5-hydroxy-6-metoxy-1,4-benzoquinol methylase